MYMLSIAFAMIIVNCHIAKADVTELQQDDKGQYCISTAEEYYFFVENYSNAPYKTSTVILTPVYNFINGRLAAESAVLKPLL